MRRLARHAAGDPGRHEDLKSDPKLAASILSTAVAVAKEGVAKEGAEPEVEASARPLKRKAAHSPPGTPRRAARCAPARQKLWTRSRSVIGCGRA